MQFFKNASYKVFGISKDSDLQPKEAWSYSIAGLGQNLICGLVSAYLVYFMTNGLLINAVTVGFIMLGVRVFDAFNDPFMGMIVDRTRTKWGKCRPYIFYGTFPIGILTVLLFLPLKPGTTQTVAIATVIYTLWSMAYTVVDVPYWGLASSLSSNTNQRASLLTVARLACTVGGGAIALVVPSLSNSWISAYTDNSGNIHSGMEGAAAAALRSNYIWLALAIVIIAMPLFFIGFKNTNERFYDGKKALSVKDTFGMLFKNKPLLLIALSGILGAAKGLYLTSGIYLAQYNLGNVSFMGMQGVSLFTVITFAVVPGGLVASLLTPYCARKFGKKNTYIYSHLLGAVVLFAMYFIGWDQPWKLAVGLIGLIIVGIPSGFANIITYAMIADTIDYLECKTGERAEGICFAMQTFISKIGMAAGAAVTCFGLGWAAIDASDASTVTRGGQDILFLVSVLIPAISMLLTVIPLFFYKFTEKEQAIAVAKTAARKAQNS